MYRIQFHRPHDQHDQVDSQIFPEPEQKMLSKSVFIENHENFTVPSPLQTKRGQWIWLPWTSGKP